MREEMAENTQTKKKYAREMAKKLSFAIEFMSSYINQLIGRISQIKLFHA